jgi:hypothetical protein
VTAFLLGAAAGSFATALVIGLCMAASNADRPLLTPGLWVVDIDEAGDVAAAEQLDGDQR